MRCTNESTVSFVLAGFVLLAGIQCVALFVDWFQEEVIRHNLWMTADESAFIPRSRLSSISDWNSDWRRFRPLFLPKHWKGISISVDNSIWKDPFVKENGLTFFATNKLRQLASSDWNDEQRAVFAQLCVRAGLNNIVALFSEGKQSKSEPNWPDERAMYYLGISAAWGASEPEHAVQLSALWIYNGHLLHGVLFGLLDRLQIPQEDLGMFVRHHICYFEAEQYQTWLLCKFCLTIHAIKTNFKRIGGKMFGRTLHQIGYSLELAELSCSQVKQGNFSENCMMEYLKQYLPSVTLTADEAELFCLDRVNPVSCWVNLFLSSFPVDCTLLSSEQNQIHCAFAEGFAGEELQKPNMCKKYKQDPLLFSSCANGTIIHSFPRMINLL